MAMFDGIPIPKFPTTTSVSPGPVSFVKTSLFVGDSVEIVAGSMGIFTLSMRDDYDNIIPPACNDVTLRVRIRSCLLFPNRLFWSRPVLGARQSVMFVFWQLCWVNAEADAEPKLVWS